MVRAALLAALMLALAAPVAAQTPAAAPAPAPTPTGLYICIYKAGPNWKVGQPPAAQDLRAHGAYMMRLFNEGRLLAGGPLTDADGGLAIVRAATPDDAKAIFAVDPAIVNGVMTGDVHAWKPFFLSDKPLKP
ncbi:MAG TPA: YciI family protein [Phenylobacterium sp.]|nr:YciI family protein [Phenylobacterium sp.]